MEECDGERKENKMRMSARRRCLQDFKGKGRRLRSFIILFHGRVSASPLCLFAFR